MSRYEYKWVSGTDPAMVELRAFRHRILYQPFGVPSARVDWDDRAENTRHLVAMSGDRIMGYCRLQRDGAEAQIRHLCVDPDERGHGLGGELIDRAMARARQDGAERIFLNARFTAQGLYRSRGFAEVGELFETEQTLLPHRRMERKL